MARHLEYECGLTEYANGNIMHLILQESQYTMPSSKHYITWIVQHPMMGDKKNHWAHLFISGKCVML